MGDRLQAEVTFGVGPRAVVSGWQAFCEDEDVCLAACLLLRSTLVGDNEARRLQVRRVLDQRDIDWTALRAAPACH